MYHHHHGKNNILASRTIFPPDRHLFMQGANIPKDTGLVLSTDAKPRLKWTPELHERFTEAINQLGGAQNATPKTIMRLMGVPGLTLYHLKSHLQKYRLSRNLQAQASQGPNKNGSTVFVERQPEISGTLTNGTNGFQTNSSLQINEALERQIEVQRRLHEQLEVQRHLQLRIEAQGKYLQSVLEKAEETLGKQNLGSERLEAAKVQLSELVSKVTNGCLNSTFLELKEPPVLNSLQTQKNQLADSSVDSCLTSCDGTQKDHGMRMGLRTYYDDSPLYRNQTGQNKLHQIQPTWADALNECRTFASSMANDPERTIFPSQRDFRDPEKTILPSQRDSREPSIWNSKQADNRSEVTIFEVRSKREIETLYFDQPNSERIAFQQEREIQGQAGVMTNLDLNANGENDAASSFK